MFEFSEPGQLAPNLFCAHSPYVCCTVCQSPPSEPELDLTMIVDADDE